MIAMRAHFHILLGRIVLHHVHPVIKENMLPQKQWASVPFVQADFIRLLSGAPDVPHVTLVHIFLTLAPMNQLHALLAIPVSIHRQVLPFVPVADLVHIHLQRPSSA